MVFDHPIADNMDGTWAEESGEHLAVGQETPYGFDFAIATATATAALQREYRAIFKLLPLDLS
jgi:hypothetical protein